MKTLNLTLRAILLFLILVITSYAAFAYDFVVKGIYYNINGDEVTVTYMRHYTEHSVSDYYTIYDYYENDNIGDVIIPEFVTFNGKTYTVTAIGDYAFYDRYATTALTSISIPKTVVSIGNSAFRNCAGLEFITIPQSVTSIGNDAFRNCNGIKTANISESVISIGDYAFGNCSGLTNIIIADSVRSVGANAFVYCSNATNLTIGKSVNSIGYNAFYGCSKLISINCLAGIPPTISGGTDCFSDHNTPKLYVPVSSVELYRTTYCWNYFTQVFGFGTDFFSIPEISAMHGDTIVIPVSMQNESEITAFQTDIYLPEGFELFQKNGEYQVSLSDRKGRDHVIMVNEAPDGAMRVLSYSPTLKSFKNNEGELFYVSIKVPENYIGTYHIWLRNTILTSTDEEELYALDALSNVTVYDHIMIMGDVNSDGAVTVSDVVTTARYILNYNPEPFVFEAADMNGDGKITITDVVKIANLVLDQDYPEPDMMRMMTAVVPGDHMSGEAIGNTISINLANEQDYTAFQLDMTLPEGMTASDFELTNRASDLGLIVKDRGHGKIRVLAYTPGLKAIKGSDGAVLTFVVGGTMGDIVVDHIELVNLNGESIHLNDFNIVANHFTALNEMNAGKTVANVDYFNLAGQQIVEPADGVTLVVTTYTDGSRTTNKIIR